MNKKLYYIIFIFIFLFSNNLFSKNVYETKFNHVDILTNNASKTKLEEINKIKIKSFINILDRILTTQDKNYIVKRIKYEADLENIIQNIIIENELITKKKYIADIKINFDKKEIVNFLRKNRVNYSDIIPSSYLIISSYTENFFTSGLSSDNIFYNEDKLSSLELENNLMNFIIPDLSPNDRFTIPYINIINNDVTSLLKISNKYKAENTFIINIYNLDNKNFNAKINLYSSSSGKVLFIDELNLINDIYFLDNIFAYLNNWLKSKYAINNNKINQLICQIQSINYEDLMNIKSKILNLSQLKSIKLITISYNNNIEKIEYYGDYKIFAKSLKLDKININTNTNCIINSIK